MRKPRCHPLDRHASLGLQQLKVWEAAAAISRCGLSIKPPRPNACQTGSALFTTSPAAVEWDLGDTPHSTNEQETGKM
ncbi:hypothetical protein NQZ68_034914 [Dissostichus eleginoides]|nr:hypothetical protein NQZ68_034914 [Dissostichus eleginoides]